MRARFALLFVVCLVASASGFGSSSCCAEDPPYRGLAISQLKDFRVRLRVDNGWVDLAFEPRKERSFKSAIAAGLEFWLFEEGSIEVKIAGESPASFEGLVASGDLPFRPKGMLSNGYQSWSISPLVQESKSAVPTDADFLNPMGQNTDTLTLDGRSSWWWSRWEGEEHNGKTRDLFATAAPRDRLKARYYLVPLESGIAWAAILGLTGESVTVQPREFIHVQITPAQRLDTGAPWPPPYWSRHETRAPFTPVGWSSWNTLFDKVIEADVLANARFIKDSFSEFGINLVQVDDGWEKNWGEWDANEKFPEGMDGTARKIRELGFIPGIWLAPFLVDETSSVAVEHPDWFLRGFDGEPVKYAVANFGGGSIKLILDTTHPEANAWMLGQIRKIVGWGYRYLKLDFLFGGAIEGKRYDSTKTALEAYRDAMQKIGDAAGPDAYIMACGAPILPSIGLAHAIRTGPDLSFFNVAYNWGFIKAEVLNLATRHFLWPAIAPDPDATLVRDVPENEARFLLAAALMAPGTFTLGDNLPALPADRLELYRRTSRLIPLLYAASNEQDEFSVPNLFQSPARIMPKTNFDVHLLPGSFPIPPVWIRRLSKAAVVAMLNGDDSPQSISVDLNSQGIGRYSRAEEIFSGESRKVEKEFTVELAPREGRLYLLASP